MPLTSGKTKEQHHSEINPALARYLDTLDRDDPDIANYLRMNNVPFAHVVLPEGTSTWMNEFFVMGLEDVDVNSLEVEVNNDGIDVSFLNTIGLQSFPGKFSEKHIVKIWNERPKVAVGERGIETITGQGHHRDGLPRAIEHTVLDRQTGYTTRDHLRIPAKYLVEGTTQIPAVRSRTEKQVLSAVGMIFDTELSITMGSVGRDFSGIGLDDYPRVFVSQIG